MSTTVEKIRFVLNLLFMIGAVASVIIYFVMSDRNTLKQPLMVGVCISAICLKFVESALRMHQNSARKKE
jgi:hypothetical protein